MWTSPYSFFIDFPLAFGAHVGRADISRKVGGLGTKLGPQSPSSLFNLFNPTPQHFAQTIFLHRRNSSPLSSSSSTSTEVQIHKKITLFPWASTTLASFPIFRKNKTHYFFCHCGVLLKDEMVIFGNTFFFTQIYLRKSISYIFIECVACKVCHCGFSLKDEMVIFGNTFFFTKISLRKSISYIFRECVACKVCHCGFFLEDEMQIFGRLSGSAPS